MISIETPQITLSSKGGWQKWKLAHAFNSIGSGTTPPTGSVEYFQGKIPWVNTGDLNDGYIYSVKKFVSEKAISEFSALKIFPQNSLIIAMYGATIGKLGILQMDACTNQACCILAKPNHLDIKFVFYSLISDRNNIIELAQGGGQPNISQEIVKNLRVFAPNIATQKSIAHFLDRKTTAIDTLIAKKQRLIQLLEEKRTALINQAVTKGLNPNAPMKKSGISWIGKIPEHWEARRLKFVLQRIVDCKNRTPVYIDEGEYAVVRTTNVRKGKFLFDNLLRTDHANYKEWTQREIPQAGHIIFTREAPAGEACTVPESLKLCLGQRTMLFVPNEKLLTSEFLLLSIYGGGVDSFVKSVSAGSTVSHLRIEQVGDLPMFIPPLKEQVSISKEVQKKLSNQEILIHKTQHSIEKLQEYRRSTITATVTGKLDIQEVTSDYAC